MMFQLVAPSAVATTALRNPHPAYRADIDGLRAIAVLAVVAFHAFPAHVQGGFVGVDIFFVVSGFLISTIIFQGLERGTFSIREFYARRITRIFPALIVVLAATLLIGWSMLLTTEYRQLGRYAAASAAFIANVVFWHEAGYFDIAAELKPLLHLWSLGVEEQFYILWPSLLLLAYRLRLNLFVLIAIITATSFGLNAGYISRDPVTTFFLPHTRLWELLIGAVLAYITLHRTVVRARLPASSNVKAVLGIALIIVAVFALRPTMAFPGWWAALPTVGTYLLISAGTDAWVNRRILSHRVIVAVGLISYPLYLWHWPLLSFLRLSMPEPSAPHIFVVVALSILLAWLTYVVIERPLRFGQLRRWSLKLSSLVVGLVFIAFAGVIIASGVLPTRLDTRLQFVSTYSYDYKNGYRGGRCLLSIKQSPEDFGAECVDGNFGDSARTSILLWGDSHGAHLYPGIRSVAPSDQMAIAQYTADDCRPTIGEGSPFCRRVNDLVFGRVIGLKPKVVVLAASWQPSDVDHIRRTIAEIKKSSTSRILVVGPVPAWQPTLPTALSHFMRQHPLAAMPSRMTYGLKPERFDLDIQLDKRLMESEVLYLSAIRIFCEPSGCLTVNDRQLIAWDDSHLTDIGSKILATEILRRLQLDLPAI